MDISLKFALILLSVLAIILVSIIILISIYAIRQRRHRKRTVESARAVIDLTKRVMVSMESNYNNAETSKAVPNLYV